MGRSVPTRPHRQRGETPPGACSGLSSQRAAGSHRLYRSSWSQCPGCTEHALKGCSPFTRHPFNGSDLSRGCIAAAVITITCLSRQLATALDGALSPQPVLHNIAVRARPEACDAGEVVTEGRGRAIDIVAGRRKVVPPGIAIDARLGWRLRWGWLRSGCWLWRRKKRWRWSLRREDRRSEMAYSC